MAGILSFDTTCNFEAWKKRLARGREVEIMSGEATNCAHHIMCNTGVPCIHWWRKDMYNVV